MVDHAGHLDVDLADVDAGADAARALPRHRAHALGSARRAHAAVVARLVRGRVGARLVAQLLARQQAQRLGTMAAAVEARLHAFRNDSNEPVDIVHSATLTNNK